MTKRITILVLSLFCLHAVDAKWPTTKGIPGVAQNLARQKGLPSSDLTVGKAINPSFPSEPVLVFSDINQLEMSTNPGVSGKFKLSIAHLAGASYLPFTVYVDGQRIGQSKAVSGKVTTIVSTFQTPLLPSHGVKLKLTTQARCSIGLIYVHWENTAFEKVPANAWNVTHLEALKDYSQLPDIDKQGVIGFPESINDQVCQWRPNSSSDDVDMSKSTTGSAIAVTHFFRPSCWAGMAFKLHTESDAILTVNGNVVLTMKKGEEEAQTVIKPQKMKQRLNRVIVRMPAGNAARFKLETNPYAGHFFGAIPDSVNPALHVADWPKAVISNGKVSATIALPDPVKGFYRGPRFDHSGMIPELRFNGHTYFGINADAKRNPVAIDQAAGVSEEFFEPIGFDEAEVGKPFMKIGVGLLEKPYAKSYFFGAPYWPVKFFDWQTKVAKNKVIFSQQASENGWGYDYSKTVTIPADRNALVVNYSLKNTGKKRITTNQYAHNFIKIDDHPIGADYTVRFSGKVRPARSLPDKVKFVKGNTFTMYDRTLFTPLLGFRNVNDNCVDVLLPSKTGIRIRGDFTPFRYWLFSSNKVTCPEPFIRIDLDPGESMTWSRTYDLY